MTPDQLSKLLSYIDARIDEKIQCALGRETSVEYLFRDMCTGQLYEAFGFISDPKGYPIEGPKCPTCKTRALPCDVCGEA